MGVHKGMKFQASKASSSLSMRKPHWYSGYWFLQWVLGIMGRRCYRGGLWSDYRGLWCHKKEIFSFSFRPKGYLSLSCNPWALNHRILRDYSPCDRASSAVFLSRPPTLGTWGFTDLAVAMLINVFSWGTKSSCLSHFYMSVLRGLLVWEQAARSLWLLKSNGDNTERRDLKWL